MFMPRGLPNSGRESEGGSGGGGEESTGREGRGENSVSIKINNTNVPRTAEPEAGGELR